jgi:DNA-binding CsgD family transcriptional regulator
MDFERAVPQRIREWIPLRKRGIVGLAAGMEGVARLGYGDIAFVTPDHIREAAKQVDKARGKLRRQDPEEALDIWKGLARGRWSLVDWFDTDGRRYVLAKPNLPRVGDPRGLTEQEALIATYAARGETGKILSYRFGISRQRISTLLGSAKRKLGVKTQAELAAKLGPFGPLAGHGSSDRG